MYKCAECGDVCLVEKIDESFDHEFGTEEAIYYVSDCCNSKIIDYYTEKEVQQSELEDG